MAFTEPAPTASGGRLSRALVWAVPASFSAILSGLTVGGRVGWQDSGFYLAAVQELGVLYPHGFVLFLLLCKLWTILFFFIPLTLSVHLFSAACAAAAAGTLAAAARDLLLTQGRLFRVFEGSDRERTASWAAGAIGCMAAAGFTFWSSALYAKSYAFLYLILSLLLRAMIRAEGTGRRRDCLIVAGLIGLAWQAHPSAVLLGPALLFFVFSQRRKLGPGGVLQGLGLAAGVAIVPTFLLPWMASRDTAIAFGHPAGFGGWMDYLTGARFAAIPGVFGIEGSRVGSIGIFLWEEMLAAVVLVVAGLFHLARANRRLLGGVGAWVIPQIAVTTLFKIEGQHDFWFVTSWLVLWLVAAVGCAAVLARCPAKAWWIAGAAGAGAIAWGVAVNARDVTQRGYDLAETFGKLHFAPVEKGSILILISDDATATCRYLQVVESYRTDVLILHETELEEGTTGRTSFYLQRHLARDRRLRAPDFASARSRFPGATTTAPAVTAFLNANASSDRAIYLQRAPAVAELLREDYRLVPAGVLQKLVPRGREASADRAWDLPLEPGEIGARMRRERAQSVNAGPDGIRVRPEAYENRLRSALIKVRRTQADELSMGSPVDMERAVSIYEALRRIDPVSRGDRALALALVRSKTRLGRGQEEEPLLDAILRSDPSAAVRAEAACLRGEILRASGKKDEAERWFREALSVPGLSPSQKADLERRARGS